MTGKPGIIPLLSAMAAVLLAGCVSQSPVLDRKFGSAVESAKATQTLDPNAGRSAGPVNGIDGPSAASAMERYRDSFKNPPPAVNVFNVGVGSTTNGQ